MMALSEERKSEWRLLAHSCRSCLPNDVMPKQFYLNRSVEHDGKHIMKQKKVTSRNPPVKFLSRSPNNNLNTTYLFTEEEDFSYVCEFSTTYNVLNPKDYLKCFQGPPPPLQL